jgi:hypothetical protein
LSTLVAKVVVHPLKVGVRSRTRLAGI